MVTLTMREVERWDRPSGMTLNWHAQQASVIGSTRWRQRCGMCDNLSPNCVPNSFMMLVCRKRREEFLYIYFLCKEGLLFCNSPSLLQPIRQNQLRLDRIPYIVLLRSMGVCIIRMMQNRASILFIIGLIKANEGEQPFKA